MLVLTTGPALRIPAPPTMGNQRQPEVASVSRAGAGWPSRQRRAAPRSCPETAAAKLLVDRGRVAACARATAGAAAAGEELGELRAGVGSHRTGNGLWEGTQGHLTGAALDRFGLAGAESAGVGARREGGLESRGAARSGDPHDGLAVAGCVRSSGSSAARSSTRWARSMVTIGHSRRPRLPRHRAVGARPAAGAEDASARFGGSSRAASGCDGARRRSRRAGSSRCRSGSTRRAAALRRRRRPRQRAGAEGDPLRGRVGPAGGQGGVADARARARRSATRWRRTTRSMRESFIWSDLREVRNMRQVFGRGFWSAERWQVR